jgi:hypothetical protein
MAQGLATVVQKSISPLAVAAGIHTITSPVQPLDPSDGLLRYLFNRDLLYPLEHGSIDIPASIILGITCGTCLLCLHVLRFLHLCFQFLLLLLPLLSFWCRAGTHPHRSRIIASVVLCSALTTTFCSIRNPAVSNFCPLSK